MSGLTTKLPDSETIAISATGLGPAPRERVQSPTPVDMASSTGAMVVRSLEYKEQQAVGAETISLDVLYPAREIASRHFVRALELLGKAIDYLAEARRAMETEDRIGCASAVLSFEELLQPLFECRAIGDGFGNVINTVHFAVANLDDLPLSNNQITTLWRVFKELAVTPFLNFPESLRIVKELRKTGLNLNNNLIAQWASESSEIESEGVR